MRNAALDAIEAGIVRFEIALEVLREAKAVLAVMPGTPRKPQLLLEAPKSKPKSKPKKARKAKVAAAAEPFSDGEEAVMEINDQDVKLTVSSSACWNC